MKKLLTNTNPFILILIPVLFALVMGVSYQFEQKKAIELGRLTAHSTSLFIKGVTMVKTVVSVAKQNVW